MPKSTKHESPLLPLQEAADYLKIHIRTLRGMRQRGEIPFVKVVSGSLAILKADLDAHIEEKTHHPRRRRRKRRGA